MENKYQTKNGIIVYSYDLPDRHSFSLSLNVKAGILYESVNETGITHLIEHLLFRRLGDTEQAELYRILDEYGLWLSGSTYKEFLRFTLTGNIRFFEEGVKIFVKLFEPLSVTKEDFLRELKRISREVRETDEKGSIDYFCNRIMWEGTSLERLVTGTPSALGKISLKRIREKKNHIFSSGNMFIYFTGAVTDSRLSFLYGEIEKYRIPDTVAGRRNVARIPEKFTRRAPDIFIKKCYYNYVAVSFEYDAVKFKPYEIDLLYDILFTGQNAFFSMSLSEKNGLIYDYDNYNERYNNIGRLYVKFEIGKDKIYESIKYSMQVFNKLKAGISDFDFRRVNLHYTENAELMPEDTDNFNWSLSYDNHILNYGYANLEEFKRLYSGVNKDRLIKIAREIFLPDNLIIAVYSNANPDTKIIKEIVSGNL